LAPAQSTLRQPNWYYIAEHPAEYQDVDQQYQFGKDLYQQALDHLTPQQQQEIRNKRIAGYAENQKLDPKQALAEMYLNFTGVIPDAQLHPQLLRWKQQHSADWMNWPGIRQALAADLKYVGDPYEEGKEIMGNAAGDAISGAARKVMGYSDKEQTPWINAVSHFVGHMATDPMNYLYGAVIPGGVIGRAANTIFATQMAAGTVQTAGQLGAILDRSDIPLQQKYDLAANAILGSIMAAHSAGNAIKGDKLPIDQRLLNEITRLGDEAKRQIFARVEQRLMRQEAPRSAPDRAAKAPVKSRVPASANTPKTNAQAAKTAAVLSRPDLSPDQKHEVIADGILQQVTASPAGPAAPRPVASPQLAPEVKTMLDYEVAHGNIEPPQPAPKPQLALDPEKIAAIGPALDWLSHADRQGVVVKLHGKLTSAIAEQGKLLGPDGQLHITNSPAEAAKLAQQLINDSISEHDQRVAEPISKPDLLRAAAPSVSEAQRVASAGAAGSLERPIADTRNVPEMGHNMTADSPAVRRAKAEGRPVRGQEPTIKVKQEPPEIQSALAQPPTPVRAEDAARIGQRDPQSGRPILQPSNDVVQNERLANQAAPELNTRLSRIAAETQGAKFERLRPQKGLERLEEKVAEGKPPRTIGDNLSAQLSVRDEQVKDQVVARLQREFPVISVDDHFLEPREKAGYPSTNVQLKLPNGSTAEVQIVAREVQKITDRTHQYYTLGRNYAEGKPERAYYWEQAAALNRQALEQYHARVAAEKAAEGLAPGQRVVLTNGLTGKIVDIVRKLNRFLVRTSKGLRTVGPEQIQAQIQPFNRAVARLAERVPSEKVQKLIGAFIHLRPDAVLDVAARVESSLERGTGKLPDLVWVNHPVAHLIWDCVLDRSDPPFIGAHLERELGESVVLFFDRQAEKLERQGRGPEAQAARQVARDIRQTMAKDGSTAIVMRTGDEQYDALTGREERAHVIQQSIGSGNIYRHANLARLWLEPEFRKATQNLLTRGYRNNPPTITLEAATKLLLGEGDTMGLTDAEQVSAIRKYLQDIKEHWGPDAADDLMLVAEPKYHKIFIEVKHELRSRATGDGKLAQGDRSHRGKG
jgi:hypothetical protein